MLLLVFCESMEEIQSAAKDIEKDDQKKGVGEDENKVLSESTKENLLVYVTLLLVTLLAAVITVIKIVLIDLDSDKYSNLFDSNDANNTNQTSLGLAGSATPE